MLELTLRCDDASLVTAIVTLAELLPASTVARVGAPAVNDAGTAVDRFVPADGIVTDTRTGLQWSQDDVTAERATWAAADAACRELRLGGHDDWRLPTRAELLTLVDDTTHDPAADSDAFPTCKSEWYWTATPYAPSPSACAWIVCFYSGCASYDLRDDDGRVRAVRGSARQF